MSREEIQGELSAYSIQIHELKQSTPHLSLYRGLLSDTEAAITVLHKSEGTDFTRLIKECEILSSLSHPNILKLLSSFWLQREEKVYYVIVTEWCAKDLEKDIMQRVQNRYPFLEADLLAIACQAIDALSYMQAMGLVHRNIKPANIYLSSSKTIKLGDFDSSSRIYGVGNDLVGTPYYFSPKLKQALQGDYQSLSEHDVFKSDVYSLGVTIIEAAKLGSSDLFMRLVTDEEVLGEIEGLQYSEELKMLLRAMLVSAENQRWDFLQLREWVSMRAWGMNITPFVLMPFKPTDTNVVYNPQGSTLSHSEWSGFNSIEPIPAPVCIQPPQTSDALPPIPIKPRPFASITLPAILRAISPSDSLEIVLEEDPEPVPCLQCGALVDRASLEAPTVQLHCRPDLDMFCSQYCFVQSIVSGKSLVCPACKEQISREQLKECEEASLKFPLCQGCYAFINVKEPSQLALLQCFTCNTRGHVCCSPQCMERFAGRCPVCVRAGEDLGSEELLPNRKRANRGCIRRLLACACCRPADVE